MGEYIASRTKQYIPLREQGNAWHKLTILVRYRFAESVEEIEALGEAAGCDVSWEWVYDQEREGELIPYAIVNHVKSGG